MTKRLSPERIAEWRKVVDRWENVGLKEIIDHIDATDRELQTERACLKMLSDAARKYEKELAEAKAEIARLKEILDDAGYSFYLSQWLPP